MITGDFVHGLHLMVGLSTDTKPDTTSENTFYLEEDTGDVYYFSEGEWSEAGAAVAGIVAALLNKGTLPAVTAADNGKVLGVDDGVWTPVEGGGGSDPRFEVTFGINSPSTPVCNKTFAQISTAISGGKLICPKFEDSDGFLAHADMLEIQCWFVSEVNGVPTWMIFSIDDTNTVTLVDRPIGNSLDPATVTITGTTPTITAQNNTNYACGELSTLTINDSTKNISFSVDFTSGSTATVLTVPSGYKAPGGDLTPEANQDYELSVRNGRAVLTPFEAVSAS